MKTTLLLAGTGALLCVLSGQAMAGVVGDPITITAQNGLGVGSFSITLADCNYDPVSRMWSYSQQGTRPILNSNGQPMASMTGLTMFMQGDPSISLGFSLEAGSTPTLFTISSALLTFGTITNPTAHSSAGMTITDDTLDGTGVTMHGNYGAFAYEANYNGLVPTGSLYSLHNPDFSSLGDGTTNSENANNNAPIAGGVSSMSSSWSFVLTPNDSASGTSNFSIIPAPNAIALLGLGGLIFSRRRR